MKSTLHGIAGVLLLGTFVCGAKAEDAASLRIPQLRETPEQRETRLQWFRDAKFGMFVHWGPASLSGEEISWGMAGRIEGGQQHMKVPRETYMNRSSRPTGTCPPASPGNTRTRSLR
jgi:hypothetical protein